MLENKKSLKVVFFRIILIAAFILGVAYILKFVQFSLGIDDMDDEEVLEMCAGWANTYYMYLVAAAASLIMSIVCFSSTGKVVSVIRTFFIAVSTALLFWPMKIMNIFKETSGVDLDDLDEVREMNDKIQGITDDEAIASLAVSMIVVAVFFILSITSIVALFKKEKVTRD